MHVYDAYTAGHEHTCTCRAPAVQSPQTVPTRATVPAHKNPPMAALLQAESTANAPSCPELIERSMPVGTVLLPAARASTGWSVRWQQRRRRNVVWRTFRCTPCRRHIDRRPSCSAGIAHGHARAVEARLHGLQSSRHTSAALSIQPWRRRQSPAGS